MKIKILLLTFCYSMTLVAQPEFQEWNAPSGVSTYHNHGSSTPFLPLEFLRTLGHVNLLHQVPLMSTNGMEV